MLRLKYRWCGFLWQRVCCWNTFFEEEFLRRRIEKKHLECYNNGECDKLNQYGRKCVKSEGYVNEDKNAGAGK